MAADDYDLAQAQQEQDARVEQAREQERTQIAREIHDELGQLLTALKLDFGRIARRLQELDPPPPGDLVDKLQSAAGLVDICVNVVRRITSRLRALEPDLRNLRAAIENEARRFSARAGIPCVISGTFRGDVNEAGARAVLKIVQEALTNVSRHADATEVRIHLSSSGRDFGLRIRDNGCGIRSSQVADPSSGGITGMRERVAALEGTLKISSSTRGTTVLVRLPVRHIQADDTKG